MKNLTTLPLAALTPEHFASALSALSLEELHKLLSGAPAVGASGPPRGLDALDVVAFAKAYVEALPIGGNAFAFVEQELVRAVLVKTGGNVSAAARLVNVDRKKLERKVRRLRGKESNHG